MTTTTTTTTTTAAAEAQKYDELSHMLLAIYEDMDALICSISVESFSGGETEEGTARFMSALNAQTCIFYAHRCLNAKACSVYEKLEAMAAWEKE